jgi:hypothetical protein
MGDNICGPAIIAVPHWVTGRLGRYYLYFSDHKGSYIRLAYAQSVRGPWTMHEPGALDIADSLFDAEDPPEPPVDERPEWAAHMKGGYLYAHIASPDVHIDATNQRINMYYHGLLPNGDQLTRFAHSEDGINFTAHEPLLGPPYFRAFERQDRIYTLTWGGQLWRADRWQGPFEPGPSLVHYDSKGGIGEGFRHGEVFTRSNTLFILYCRMGDRPERILYVSVDMSPVDWNDWRADGPYELLAPQETWEGADLPLETSTMGAERHRVRELRDPCVFEDADGAVYMLYCGAGESAIGLATLDVGDG